MPTLAAMTRRPDAPIGAPNWLDLSTSDVPASCEFYTRLLGWTLDEVDEDHTDFIGFLMNGELIAGTMAKEVEAQYPDSWSVYLATSDAEATARRAEAIGAQIILGSTPVEDLGNFVIMIDPTGAEIGAWEPKVHRGFAYIDEPGAPCWFELWTRDFDAAVEFYRSVFDWTVDTTAGSPKRRYARLVSDGAGLAGVMEMTDRIPPEVPAHWVVHFEVLDVEAAVVSVDELGGSVMGPIEDSPFGRFVTCADTTGAMFTLVQRRS